MNGMYIKIKVLAGAKKDEIKEISKDHFNISVRAPAERCLANKRIIELVREYFKLYNGDVKIVSGHHSVSKIISIEK